MITAPATSGRVTVPLRVTFQVLEPTPSSTALSLTKCALTAWALVPIISYSVNSSFIKLCLDYMSFFFPHWDPSRALLSLPWIIEGASHHGLYHKPYSPSSSVHFSSVTQSCPTLCNPMNCSIPGLPVHHQLPEFTQTHVHRVSDAIQPSHPLSSPSPAAPNPSQHQSLF